VVNWLDGPEAMGAGHGDLEARLQVYSREQYRLLLQGHLDERARLEKRRGGVTGGDGVPRPRVENGHRRELTTVLGPVTVTRKAYRASAGTGDVGTGTTSPTASDTQPGPASDGTGMTTGPTSGVLASTPSAGNLHPADAVLNLPVGRPSAGLARLAAVEAARGSFDDAQEAIERATGVQLGKRQVEGLARHAAVDVDAFYTARRPQPCPDRVLGLQCDGKGIVMRPGHLRPGTAKLAAKASAKLSTRLSPGEKHGRKRMAELVAVYDLDPGPRTSRVGWPPASPTTSRPSSPACSTKPSGATPTMSGPGSPWSTATASRSTPSVTRPPPGASP
jgi:hypothetical protein